MSDTATPARFNPSHAFVRGLQNYTNFSGRANRREFWLWTLMVFVINLAASALDAAIGTNLVELAVGLALLLPGLAIAVRRLHDTNRSGWWLLLLFVLVVGWIVLIVFYCLPSDPGTNDYGEPSTIGQQ